MDVVIPVRPGENDELRYALRSIDRNVGHDRVIIAGHKPHWCVNVTHVPTRQDRVRRSNATLNILAACNLDDLSNEIIVTADDIHVMRCFDELPTWNAGLLEDVIASTGKNGYRHTLQATLERLTEAGATGPLCYDALHRPQVFDRDGLAEIITDGWPMPFTAYGNLHRPPGGVTAVNAKRLDGWQGRDVLSTSDRMFATHPMAAHVRAQFTQPSRYER